MIVETQPGKESNWLGKYMYQTPLKMAKADIADGVNAEEYALLKSEIEKGFDKLALLYSEDRKGNLKTERALTFLSDFLSPRHNFEMLGELIPSEADRINIRTVGGVYSLPKDSVEIKPKESNI